MQDELRSPRPVTARVDEHRSDSESDDDTPSKRPRGRIQDRRENDKTATELFAYAVLWWAALGVVHLLDLGQGISRRVVRRPGSVSISVLRVSSSQVNLPYILWVAAFNTSFLLGYLLLDLVFFSSPLSRSVYSPTSKLKVQPDPVLLNYGRRDGRPSDGTPGAPALFEAINRNGLVFFLLVSEHHTLGAARSVMDWRRWLTTHRLQANVSTGLINLTVPTMFTSDWWAMAILVCYSLAICTAAWVTRSRRLCRF